MSSIDRVTFRAYASALTDKLEQSVWVSVGEVPSDFYPSAPVAVNESCSWMIVHARTYTMYGLYSKKCQTYQHTGAHYLLCLFVPADQRLADGKSPLEVLSLMNDNFTVYALRGGMLGQQPLSDNVPFAKVLQGVRLQGRGKMLPVMMGGNVVSWCANDMEQVDELMRNSRYSSLSDVGRLEIGLHCTSTVKLHNKVVDEPGANSVKGEQGNSASASTSSLSLDDVDSHDDQEKKPVLGKKGWWIIGIVALCALVGLWIVGSFPNPEPNPHPHSGEEVLLTDTGKVDSISLPSDRDNMSDLVGQKQHDRKQEVLEYVNLGDLKRCRNIDDRFKVLTPEERAAVESVLYLDQYKNPAVRKKIQSYVKKELPFHSWDRLLYARRQIIGIVNSHPETTVVQPRPVSQPITKPATESTAPVKPASPPQPVVPAWHADVKKKAAKCPVSLRFSVLLESISYTQTTVTCVLKYEDMSKYDKDDANWGKMSEDENKVKSTYLNSVPASVKILFVKKDRQGRTL